jgi:hypothetical protein
MATTTLPAPEAQPQATISPFGRIIGVFFSPKATFEDIVKKPSWLTPLVLLTLFSIAATVVFNQRVNWREFMSQQIEKSPRAANLSAEQKQQQIEAGAKITPIVTYTLGVCGPALFVLVLTLIMWGAYNLLGGANTNFGTSFAIITHSSLPGLLSSTLLILVLFLKPYGTVDVENPLATNVAALLAEDSAKWLIALGKSIDIFSFWTLILVAIGFAATNPKKLRGSKAYSIAFGLWAAWVVLRVGWAFISS